MNKTLRVKSCVAVMYFVIILVSLSRASDPNDPNIVATPLFNPDGGTYNTEQNVIITCTSPGATIYYTTDGSDPNNGMSITSGNSVLVDHILTLKAVGWKNGFFSSVKSAAYNLIVATPVFNPNGGNYETEQNVAIICATSGATLRYTIDGSDPNEGFIIDSGSSVVIPVAPPTILKAQAFKTGWINSSVKTAVYRQPGNSIYVDANAMGANNGTSWEDAYTDLQSALNEAVSGNEIWVVAGTYTPSVKVGGMDEGDKTFQLKNGVALYGGFTGTETSRQQRNYTANKTILSGAGYCYHVFYHPEGTNLDNTAVLDGFTIRDGCNDRFESWGVGDGEGAGMFNSNSSPIIRNCIFYNNIVHNWVGGGELLWDIGRGGGMFNYNCQPVIINCIFVDNGAGYGGYDSGGGGIFNSQCSPVLTNCIFINNGHDGLLNVHSNPLVTNCTFTNHKHGICNYYSNPILTNCTFTNHDYGISNEEYSNPIITNCILWGNKTDISNIVYSTPSVTYSNIQDGYPGAGNIDGDPLFVNAPSGNLSLQTGSPCIDTGNNTAVPVDITSDLAGERRIVDGNCDNNAVVDMGAYEYYKIGELDTICGVNMGDFNLFTQSWMKKDCQKPDNCNQADLDHDGTVQLDDLNLFAQHWLEGM